MTRTGKIARLPLAIRNELGARLHDGQPGKTLVAWLNTLPEVQQTLATLFHGRPITPQNLSEWKQRGYPEWLRHQDALDWATQMQEQVAELTQATNGMPLSEGLATLLAVALGRSLHALMAQPLDTSQQRRELLALARELTRLRSADLRAASLTLRQEKQADTSRQEPEQRLSPAPNPSESDSIQPNQTQSTPPSKERRRPAVVGGAAAPSPLRSVAISPPLHPRKLSTTPPPWRHAC